MNKNIEKEYKILISKAQFEKLTNLYAPLSFQKQFNQYYDTVDHQLEKCQGAMRIRTKNNIHIFTLKLYEGNDLLEFECRVSENCLAALQHLEIQKLLKNYGISGPFIKTASLTTYRAMIIDKDAELCFDENHYNNTCDYEIEYEFKREHNGLAKFNQILSKIDVQYEQNCKSKIARVLNK